MRNEGHGGRIVLWRAVLYKAGDVLYTAGEPGARLYRFLLYARLNVNTHM
jgi:hypothetical protein